MASLAAAAMPVTSARAGGHATPTAVAGGYTPVAVSDQQVMAAAIVAVDAQRTLMAGPGDPVVLERVSVSAAGQQVVAGINYRLQPRVRRDGAGQIAEAVVWWQARRQPDPCRPTSWEWR
jgi:hypothetical protein